MRWPSHQIQEGSTPENHVQVMRNVSRFYIELRQVQNTYSLSQTALSPLLRVMLDDSKVHGLKLALRPCGRPLPLFLLGFLSSPLSPPFLFFTICPSDSHTGWKNIPRTMHQLTHRGLQGGDRPYPG